MRGFAVIVILFVGGGIIVSDGAQTNAAGGLGIDGRPCPVASQLRHIAHLHQAVPAAKRFAHLTGRRGVIRELTHGNRSDYAPTARRVCGAEVVKLSVYVDVHPRGQICSACDLHAFVVRNQAGHYRVWEAY
jgi:hypothetical protein